MSCGHRPPALAHPQLPLRPRLPDQVDPDRWLEACHGQCFARRVKTNGTVLLDGQAYYVGSRYAGQAVVAQVDAPTRQVCFLDVQRRGLAVKPLRGVVGAPMTLEAFVPWCAREARTLWRRSLHAHHPLQRVS